MIKMDSIKIAKADMSIATVKIQTTYNLILKFRTIIRRKLNGRFGKLRIRIAR